MGWGFIRANNIATRVIPALRMLPGQELVGVVSRDEQRARQFAAEQGLTQSHTALAHFLAEGRLYAVYISSTNEQHSLGAGDVRPSGRVPRHERQVGLCQHGAIELDHSHGQAIA